ncbi:MAG TPA: DNA-directed RNA polymerase subunit beta' [Smithella sp.]|nr:DNA-directed RNA polymerase subunit beta' [Smithella sp.]HNQ66282.1 DNA-directed RNA polymerase subunit beta' [Smithella sp.]HOE32817.1 DNA-directed RNA polymerase subunit beta' [Smithella sp.]HOG09150.1 DNA-directed RNA polymerase subunit beta' [Smithella sp.]HOO35066.1 DNA-directed RNA polymerase subunit beta' [Smithella sp.]
MEDVFSYFEKPKNLVKFNAMQISIASPDKILSWSHGEVKKPETINYRTFKPEKDGLFCAKIFGPVKDYECLCGRYKRMKHRGVVCEKCGVEVIQSKVRRERMGHITLATPVAHIWFLKSLPSRIGNAVDLSLKELEKVLYFESWIVLDPKNTPLKKKDLLSDEEYEEAREQYGNDGFVAGIGAEAIRQLLEEIDLEKLYEELRTEIVTSVSDTKKKKLVKRLKVVEALRKSGNKPEWMILTVLPVIPPDLRPLVPLDGGRFATSDLNDLYRRVINRNNRLKRLQELNAPEIIIRNEKRMLQEAVDVLFDNGRRGRAITGTNKRPLRSLSDMLKGKQGRFRQNLLGKRVDYSGRSVVTVGPDLRLHQCGLPKKMAIELFKPFIYNRLLEKGYVTTVKSAKKMVEKESAEVWDALDEVVREYPIILNRAPTLHRLGIQAFEPVLIEGKAIQLHPLVCTAFNADFDGDQMAVHIPLSVEAQTEARVLMMSTNNILSPANGSPIIIPSQDIVLGIYYLTRAKTGVKGDGMIFAGPDEVRAAIDNGVIDLHARIKVRIDSELKETTAGRIILSEIVPEQISFDDINKLMNKKELTSLIDHCYRLCGDKTTIILADKLKDLGFKYATVSGLSFAVGNMIIPEQKKKIVLQADKDVLKIQRQYMDGLITDGERYNKVVDIWAQATEKIASEMLKGISTEDVPAAEGKKRKIESFNPIYMMADSGARGSGQQLRQLAGMRGLMAKPSGEIIETPITANFREGLTVLQYFISTHGARKGLADTALKTANSGYLTRRLVDVAQDCIITEHDCETVDGVYVSALMEGGEIIETAGERVLGRVALQDVKDPFSGEVIVPANQMIDETLAEKIDNAGIEKVHIRSVLTCRSKHGVCAMCYGRDLAHGHLVNIGEAVGIVAAQSIGEPGTQLTMRTFHIGGTAKFDEHSTLEARHDGIVKFVNLSTVKTKEGDLVVMKRNGEVHVLDEQKHVRGKYVLSYGAHLKVTDNSEVKKGQLIAEWDPFSIPILAEVDGTIKFDDITEGKTMQEQVDEVTGLSRKIIVEFKGGDLRPRVSIKDEKGKTAKLADSNAVARYLLSVGVNLVVSEGDQVRAGDIIAKIPRETTKTKDITGGLPRVAELFEARKPKDFAVISEISGVVSYGKDAKGKRKIVVTPEVGEEKEYLIPKGKHISVQEGDVVSPGDALMSGVNNPHDLLSIKGEKELARYLVDEVQEVYRLQGVKINDKHMEVIVRQMLRRVKVMDPGDTAFIADEKIERYRFQEENEKIIAQGGRPAIGEPMLLGITKASLSTQSFISAASFQETTKVLTEAALSGKTDYLRGLKENVIMGRLITAGTGLVMYRKLGIALENENAETAAE